MELLSLDMKRRGVFLSRLISFKDVKVDMLDIKLTNEFFHVYSKSCELVSLKNNSKEEHIKQKDKNKIISTIQISFSVSCVAGCLGTGRK